MKMTGNTILITGATSGIGRALAEGFHERGNQVIVTGRRQAHIDLICKGRPGMFGTCVDLNDRVSTAQFGAEIRSRYPSLNVLIANAGISRPEDMSVDHWNTQDAEAIVETNILGVIRATAAALPVLKLQKHATIMATSSALAFVPKADFPTYCATKAFLHSWLTSLRHQLRKVPVEVLELLPPYVQTELTGAQQAVDPRAMPLDSYVAQTMRILEKGSAVDGEVLLDDDLPRRWAERDGRYRQLFSSMNPS